jgi:hypothetical protein
MMMELRFAICDLRLKRARWRCRGFSFTEIMFAVIILGVGFIMVAAIFPVAIQQAKSTTEETTAAAIARGAATYLGGTLSDGQPGPNQPVTTSTSNCPPAQTPRNLPSGQVQIGVVQQPQTVPGPFVPLWTATRQNLILPEDRRYAFIYLYRREGDPANSATWSPYAQLYIFPVQARLSATFDDTDFIRGNLLARPNAQPPTPMPAPVKATVTDKSNTGNTAQVDLIAFQLDPPNFDTKAAVEGAYVVVANDNTIPTAGRVTGQMFKLGAQRLDLDANGLMWELQPGNDFTPDPGPDGLYNTGDDVKQVSSMDVYIIGRSKDSSGKYDGPALPISAYTTFVKVN